MSNNYRDENDLQKSFIAKIIAGILILVVGIIFIFKMVTTVNANETVVKQGVGGAMEVWMDPGIHWQNFGTITRYDKSSQYWFSASTVEGKTIDESIKVRFNDGGHGNVSGSLRYNLPTDPAKMLELHRIFHSMAAIDHDLIRQVVNKSVYMTGPLMSSRESYAEKRADLISFITDQIEHGVYRTERHSNRITDIISGQEKTIDVVQPKNGPGPNGIEREEISPIETFGITAYNITLNGIEYDPQVEEQIKQQQQATMAVQQAMVDARKAEQAAITTAKQGEAEAAKAKWIQEVEKAKAVTEAQQQKEVAALNLETAKLAAEQTVTEAKADSEAKKLALTADNALDKKLKAFVDVQTAWANAYGNQRQTPDIQFGSGSGAAGTSQSLIEMLTAKTAREIGVNTAIKQ